METIKLNDCGGYYGILLRLILTNSEYYSYCKNKKFPSRNYLFAWTSLCLKFYLIPIDGQQSNLGDGLSFSVSIEGTDLFLSNSVRRESASWIKGKVKTPV